jgi:hypothetical protein
MANTGPFWFDISSPAEIHKAHPNGTVVSSDFAFSPDGEWLAFWGCGGSEENCGVYLQNTRTLRTVKLLSLSFGAIFFTWSPDGESLAMMTAENTLLVVSPRTAEITYASAPFDYLEDGAAALIDY